MAFQIYIVQYSVASRPGHPDFNICQRILFTIIIILDGDGTGPDAAQLFSSAAAVVVVGGAHCSGRLVRSAAPCSLARPSPSPAAPPTSATGILTIPDENELLLLFVAAVDRQIIIVYRDSITLVSDAKRTCRIVVRVRPYRRRKREFELENRIRNIRNSVHYA